MAYAVPATTHYQTSPERPPGADLPPKKACNLDPMAPRSRQKRQLPEGPQVPGAFLLCCMSSTCTARLKICGRCGDHDVRYCSVTCQQSHWEVHRDACSYQRRLKRRECVICARTVEYEDPAFPVCDCGRRVYCGEACQAQDWAAGHKLRCALQPRYRPVTPDASADPLDALAADVLAVLDDDLDDVDDI